MSTSANVVIYEVYDENGAMLDSFRQNVMCRDSVTNKLIEADKKWQRATLTVVQPNEYEEEEVLSDGPLAEYLNLKLGVAAMRERLRGMDNLPPQEFTNAMCEFHREWDASEWRKLAEWHMYKAGYNAAVKEANDRIKRQYGMMETAERVL
jgi:hypothetical protein